MEFSLEKGGGKAGEMTSFKEEKYITFEMCILFQGNLPYSFFLIPELKNEIDKFRYNSTAKTSADIIGMSLLYRCI